MVNDYIKPPKDTFILEQAISGNKDNHDDPIYENTTQIRKAIDDYLNQGDERPEWLYTPDRELADDPVQYGIDIALKLMRLEDGELFVWPKDQRLVPPCNGQAIKRFPVLPVRRIASRTDLENNAGKPMYAHLCDSLLTIQPGHVFVGIDYQYRGRKHMVFRLTDCARAWAYIKELQDEDSKLEIPEIKTKDYGGSSFIDVQIPSFSEDEEKPYEVSIERAVLIERSRFRKGEVLPRPLTAEEGLASFATEITSDCKKEKQAKNVAGREIYVPLKPRLLDPFGKGGHEYEKRQPFEQLVSHIGISGYFVSELRMEKEEKGLLRMFPHSMQSTLNFLEAASNQMLIEKNDAELEKATIGQDGRPVPSDRYRAPHIDELEVALFQRAGVINIVRGYFPGLEERLRR